MTELTAGQIRKELRRVRREEDRFAVEIGNLTVGVGVIGKRLEELRADSFDLRLQRQTLQSAETHLATLPRGRRVTVPDLVANGPVKTYNPHRRLAVMERSFL